MKIWTALLSGRAAMGRTYAFPALIALVAILGAAHILVRTSTYGAAALGDAFNYLAAAESLTAGEGLLSPGGEQMVLFAPFFSMAMAFLSLLGIEPVDGGRLLNAAAFGLIILATGLWLSRRLKSRLVALGAAVAVMAGLPLAHFASTLLSEPLFSLFILLALMPMESFLAGRSGKPALALSAVFTALAALTRYMGVALIFSLLLMLLLRRRVPIRERLKETLVFGAISSLPLAAALARNQLVSGTLTGDRSQAAGQPLSDSLYQIVVVFEGWADPLLSQPQWYLHRSPWLIAGLALVLAAVFLITPPPPPRPGRASYVFWVFSLAYLGIIAVATPFMAWQAVDSRYLTPVYAPLLVVAAFWLDGLLRGRRRDVCSRPGGSRLAGLLRVKAMVRAPAVWRTLVVLTLIGVSWHIGASAWQNLRATAGALDSGYVDGSLNTAYWADSEVVEYVRNNPSPGRYYSNIPNVLRWNAGVPARRVSWVPVTRRDLHNVYDCPAWFERAVEKSRKYDEPEKLVVWVGHVEDREMVCTILQMETPLPLEPVAELSDGAIFRVNAAFDSAAARLSAFDALVSDFDVYLSEDALVYAKEPCAPADTEAVFFLHLYPVDVDDLPDNRKQYGFDNLDFRFANLGLTSGERCVATVDLPEYDISEIKTGQYVETEGGSTHRLWEVEILFDALGQADAINEARRLIAAGEPVIRSGFDVYLSEDTLVYVKEPCAPADTEATFFLHLYPVDVNDLPDNRKQYGFDNLDFRFANLGLTSGERCVATVDLPEYDISEIKTGQYVETEGGSTHRLWEEEFLLDAGK